MKILYAEDEVAMSEAVTDILTYHKYTVDAVYDGDEALAFARAETYDAIILDIMMPKKSGMEVLRTLRAEGCKTPIILLTAKAEVEDRVEGLDAGADDYLPKPFDMGELLARVRAVLRRRENFTPEVITCGDLSLNMQSSELSCGDRSFVLSKIEYRIMELLMLHRGMYFSTEDLLTKVWGYDTESELGIVWVYISNLRKKLVSLHAHAEIRVKRGIGYVLEAI
ncbi:MAG: response regulator transcription factor [Clostridia bacterium]|nr:response regulator transcription factor [Clostridia bacterium]